MTQVEESLERLMVDLSPLFHNVLSSADIETDYETLRQDFNNLVGRVRDHYANAANQNRVTPIQDITWNTALNPDNEQVIGEALERFFNTYFTYQSGRRIRRTDTVTHLNQISQLLQSANTFQTLINYYQLVASGSVNLATNYTNFQTFNPLSIHDSNTAVVNCLDIVPATDTSDNASTMMNHLMQHGEDHYAQVSLSEAVNRLSTKKRRRQNKNRFRRTLNVGSKVFARDSFLVLPDNWFSGVRNNAYINDSDNQLMYALSRANERFNIIRRYRRNLRQLGRAKTLDRAVQAYESFVDTAVDFNAELSDENEGLMRHYGRERLRNLNNELLENYIPWFRPIKRAIVRGSEALQDVVESEEEDFRIARRVTRGLTGQTEFSHANSPIEVYQNHERLYLAAVGAAGVGMAIKFIPGLFDSMNTRKGRLFNYMLGVVTGNTERIATTIREEQTHKRIKNRYKQLKKLPV